MLLLAISHRSILWAIHKHFPSGVRNGCITPCAWYVCIVHTYIIGSLNNTRLSATETQIPPASNSSPSKRPDFLGRSLSCAKCWFINFSYNSKKKKKLWDKINHYIKMFINMARGSQSINLPIIIWYIYNLSNVKKKKIILATYYLVPALQVIFDLVGHCEYKFQ